MNYEKRFNRKEEGNNQEVDETKRRILDALGAGAFTLGTGKLGFLLFGNSKESNLLKSDLETEQENLNSDNNLKKEKDLEKVHKDIIHSLEVVMNEVDVSEGAKDISRIILKQYLKLAGTNFFPEEIFNDAFFLAVMQKESSYIIDAVSKSDAVGIMQTKEIIIRDLMESFNKFKEENPVLFNQEFPKKVSIEISQEVLEIIKKSGLLGEATGRLYYSSLFNRYGIGVKEYQKGDIEGAQKILLAAYNAGPSIKRKPENEWPEESKEYYKKILEYQKKIKKEIESVEIGKRKVIAIDNFKNNKG